MPLYSVRIKTATGESRLTIAADDAQRAIERAANLGEVVIDAERIDSPHSPEKPDAEALAVPPAGPGVAIAKVPSVGAGVIVAGLACACLCVLALILHNVLCDWVVLYSFQSNPDGVIHGEKFGDRTVLMPAPGTARQTAILAGIIAPIALAMGAVLCGVYVLIRSAMARATP